MAVSSMFRHHNAVANTLLSYSPTGVPLAPAVAVQSDNCEMLDHLLPAYSIMRMMIWMN